MEIMTKVNNHLLIAALTLSVLSANAREKYGNVYRTTTADRVMSGCSPAQSSAELSVNNVRTIIYSGSDMWWDLFGGGNAWYLVPKVEDRTKGASSNFAGNVWLGGLDVGGQLKIAAQTYRQSGVDFWTGPLSTIDATTTSDVCQTYDKIYKMKRSEVDAFVLGGGSATSNILNWPGNGNIALNHDPNLAPYFDKDGSGDYNPEQGGDYPDYDVKNEGLKDNLGVCKARLFGDETLWWVYNDNGSNHVATGGKAIGIEVRAQAFAFQTTDEINNMTFYNYQLINRSSFEIRQTYMTVWTDADLGYYGDDYIGCDVQRGLGYIYNSDNFDESVSGTPGYGTSIPALGCDFFQGPINATDNIDNNNNGVIDEPGEQMGMTKFLYFNNSFAGVPLQTTDPGNAQQYYQYMTGFWRDGTPFTCNSAGTGNGYGESTPTSFVYPADTYSASPCGPASWSEGGVAGDRRFMQSSGPFTLKPGAVNYVTFGLPWARTTTTDAKASIPLLKLADDKAQALFDNCFRVLSGPEAPDMTIQEMENELIIYFSNKPSSNNYLNNYKELDVSILPDTVSPTHPTGHYRFVDRYYHFEGFKVYQLKNNQVSRDDINDASKAKLVFTCDLANNVTRLVNYEFDATAGGDVPKVKVESNADMGNKGIKSTFHFTQDQFTLDKVTNNKEYYFLCVAYAYNQYGEYKEDTPWLGITTNTATTPTSYYTPACSEGQKRPYLEGRLSKKAFGIPHNPAPEKEGSITNSVYGYGPKITRLEGQGNGGNFLELTQESVDQIIANEDRVDVLTYENGRGPINIKVVDPLNVPNSKFSFAFINRNYFFRNDTLTGNLAAQNQYINSVINADPCRTKATSTGTLAPHVTLPYPLLNPKNTQFGKINADTATWVLKDLTTKKEYYPCKAIRVGEEFYFSDLGLSINIAQSRDVAQINSPTNDATDKIVQPGDLIEGSSISFSDNSNWLTGLKDVNGSNPYNWIRSGQFVDKKDPTQNDYEFAKDAFVDPTGIFSGVVGGTWAPYVLTASSKPNTVFAAPAYGAMTGTVQSATESHQTLNSFYDIRALASVDVVLTKDKSKWTRSIVLEECDESTANPSGAKKLEPRRSRSVDKQGIPLGAPGCNLAEASVDSIPGVPFQYGLSWFPGYAINLETGERLNIAFGEDSYQSPSNPDAPNNGNDMMWNPTSMSTTRSVYPYAFGGRHYIYVFGHNRSTSTYSFSGTFSSLSGKQSGVGTYKKFADFAYSYKFAYANIGSTSGVNLLHNIWNEAMWVNIPLLANPRYNFKDPSDMPSDAKVKLRVKRAYRYGLSGSFSYSTTPVPVIIQQNVMTDVNGTTSGAALYAKLTKDLVSNPVNNNFGLYTFNTGDIYTETNNSNKQKSALDLINVVPNPYYAYSAYERDRKENVVRITNLPNRCKIKIYTLNGTLIRTFDRDLTGQEDIIVHEKGSAYDHSKRLPFQDWDMKNQSGISVASGLYIIHISVPDVGEKILKWFGVMRPLDLQSY